MKASTEHQFATLEDAHSFVVLLAETVNEAKREIQNDVQRESDASRRLDALRIVLLSGCSLKNAANLCGVTHNTAKSPFKAIFVKTDVKRQSELVRLLLKSSGLRLVA